MCPVNALITLQCSQHLIVMHRMTSLNLLIESKERIIRYIHTSKPVVDDWLNDVLYSYCIWWHSKMALYDDGLMIFYKNVWQLSKSIRMDWAECFKYIRPKDFLGNKFIKVAALLFRIPQTAVFCVHAGNTIVKIHDSAVNHKSSCHPLLLFVWGHASNCLKLKCTIRGKSRRVFREKVCTSSMKYAPV